jgi:hypothetical protein
LKAGVIPNRASAPAWASFRLVKSYGRERVEAACLRALEIGARTYRSVKSILDNNLDRQAAAKSCPGVPAIPHANIRGPRYYH